MIRKPIRGTVHGRTIELSKESGCADGAVVEVQLQAVEEHRTPGIGFLRTEGALVDDEEWDEIMAKIEAARKNDSRGETDFS